ncbi:MAG: ribosome biogenesis GTPase YlqF [Oscillospiraceae bacterium]
MLDTPSIQWFPGHMAKTRRLMLENLKMVDIVVEITDARIPKSSRNPEIDRLIENKPRIILLNKCDAADASTTKKWCKHYESLGISALPTDCKSGQGLKLFIPLVKEVLKELIQRREAKGIGGKPLRMMIVGIPNVGKSSFINRMANAKKTKVADRPGVTRGKQWVKVENNVELLDMPGVLWPKFEDPEVGKNLAFTGAVKDDVIDIELLAMLFLQLMKNEYLSYLLERYNITQSELDAIDEYSLLKLVGKKRGMVISGGEIDTLRAAIMVIDEFRSGKLGHLSLEKPPVKKEI